MGRIKTTLIKRNTLKLFDLHKDKFKTNFNENKPLVDSFLDLKSKKLRNIIAGYVTRLKKQKTE